jgi:hypothetical protein
MLGGKLRCVNINSYTIAIALIISLIISSLSTAAMPSKAVLFITISGRDNGVKSLSVSEGLTTFAQSLQSAGYKVEEMEFITADILSEYQVLVVHDAAFYNPSYTPLIRDFVNAGGGLLIFSEGINYAAFKELTQQFGVVINQNMVYQNGYVIEISAFNEHAIFKDIKALQAQFSSVTVQPPAQIAARSGVDSYTTGEEKTYGTAPPVIAYSQLGKGRVVIVGSHYIFRNYDIAFKDNLKFGFNCIEWLSAPEIEHAPTLAPTQTPVPTLTPTITPTPTTQVETPVITPVKTPSFEAVSLGIVLLIFALKKKN